MIVTFAAKTFLTTSGKVLKPGSNIVDAAWWEKAREHKSIKKKLESGSIVEEQDLKVIKKAGKKGEKDADANHLQTLKQPQAIVMIKETIDVDLLKAWEKVEQRKVVQASLAKQIKAVTTPATDAEVRVRGEKRQLSTGRGPDVIELTAKPGPQDD